MLHNGSMLMWSTRLCWTCRNKCSRECNVTWRYRVNQNILQIGWNNSRKADVTLLACVCGPRCWYFRIIYTFTIINVIKLLARKQMNVNISCCLTVANPRTTVSAATRWRSGCEELVNNNVLENSYESKNNSERRKCSKTTSQKKEISDWWR